MNSVRRIRPDEGPRLRAIRLAAVADAPGEAITTLARVGSRTDDQWAHSAAANASGPLQATFFAVAERPADEHGDPDGDPEPIGVIGAYANQDGTVNLVGLWSAPGHRDIGVASALIDEVADWARRSGAHRLRLWVVERSEHTRRFYEDEGFVATGATIAAEPGPQVRQAEMVRSLV